MFYQAFMLFMGIVQLAAIVSTTLGTAYMVIMFTWPFAVKWFVVSALVWAFTVIVDIINR